MQNNRFRKGIIASINTPLGFYVLALAIVESFLTLVLTQTKLEASLQALGIRAGIGLFLFVVSVVSIFVWFKPTHLIFTELGILVERGKATYGTETRQVLPGEMQKGEPATEEED